ncbi:MAG: ATP12 family protein [Rhizomicrobium sp.]|jgi:chaperone required for assembly of F1-ATPase
MTKRAITKFYHIVSTEPVDDGFTILLDGKPVKTPARAALVVPNRALADAIAQEWRDQEKTIEPATMPLTGLAYAALDLAPKHRGDIVDHVLGYGRSDLLCYRAPAKEELGSRQVKVWDPILHWASDTYDIILQTGEGVTYIEQPAGTVLALEKIVTGFPDFELVALDRAASLTGSLILALALASGRLTAEGAFAAAHVDEEYQTEKWGRDAAAEARRKSLLAELAASALFLGLTRDRET